MRYCVHVAESFGVQRRHIIEETFVEQFTSFPAEVGNPNFDAFLESQGLTDAEVQAMEPDEWHDMAASVI